VTKTGCLICDQVESIDVLPGGSLVDDALVAAYHLPPIERFPRQYLGRVLLVTRRHVDHLGDLTPDEAAAAGLAARTVAHALRSLGDVTRVHLAVIGLHVPHFHLHLIARYDWVPDDSDWNALHELPGAPLGGSEEIAAFVERLRPYL
jgi:diadenosine tetraphosphate (Ap4A) HIT family hydrolase